MIFREDHSPLWKENAHQNFSIHGKLALNLLTRHSSKHSIKRKAIKLGGTMGFFGTSSNRIYNAIDLGVLLKSI